MKKIQQFLAVLFMVCFTMPTIAANRIEIKGNIIDALTKEPLSGANIYIVDLKIITTSNAKGEFIIENVPAKGKFLVEVRYVGYKTVSKLINLSEEQNLNFALEPSVIESAEVVITGTPIGANSKTNSLAVVSVTREKIAQSGATNLVDAIAKVPGVAQVTTGGAISKPSIRGLGYNRVLTMVDGAREEAQQWGDEHGVEVDQFSAARIEVLKGPASLLYGSDALGGVINIIDDFVSAMGDFNGSFTTNYSTNNGLTASSLMAQGNQNGFVYRGRVSYKNAHGFGYGDKIVPNSSFNETNFSGMLGLNRTWGYAHLNLSRFGTNIGLVEDGPGADGRFLDEDGNVLSNADAKQRKMGLPYQNINHYRAAFNSNILLAGGQLKTNLAFQQNIRKEFEETMDEPGLNLHLNSYTYDLKYAFGNRNNWEPTIGLQGMYQKNVNHGDEFLIPDYHSNNIGAFVYLKRSFENGAVNAGVRYDYKSMNGADLIDDGEQVFTAFTNKFSNISGSIGIAFELVKNLTVKGNAGSGFRAPNIAELGANGKHEGTFRYEIGNSQLKQETSLQFDLGLTYDAKHISMGLNAYHNRIYNYIYLGNFNNETILAPELLPVYRFVQTNADLIGGEASVDFHFIEALHFENTFAYVKGTNRANDSALPFIPAASISNELRFEPEIKGLKDSFVKLGFTNVFKQSRFDSFETETAGYTLIDAGIGTAVKTKNGKINLWLNAQNLGNKLYYNHLSRYKLAGIYNPGRNISLGISVPL